MTTDDTFAACSAPHASLWKSVLMLLGRAGRSCPTVVEPDRTPEVMRHLKYTRSMPFDFAQLGGQS